MLCSVEQGAQHRARRGAVLGWTSPQSSGRKFLPEICVKIGHLVDVSDIFIFSARLGREKGESEAPGGGGGSLFLIENPTKGRGGGGSRRGRGLQGVYGELGN